MFIRPLPPHIHEVLERLKAPARLKAHLQLVYDAACTLTDAIDCVWPTLTYDRDIVRMGAALHDIGKIHHHAELTGPGNAHEASGETLLLAEDFPEHLARIARTHSQWDTASDVALEDLFVAIADTWWRGKRDEMLETIVCQRITHQTHEKLWHVFLHLGSIANDMTAHGDARIVWQSQHR